MGNDNTTSLGNTFQFLDHKDAPELFGKLDYMLKDGVHFQNREDQYDYFRFIEENEESMRQYYLRFFEVNLEQSGEDSEKYYYLDFNSTGRGNIDIDHRYFLKNEYVIIGFLIYKVIYIDRNFDLTSVKVLQTTIKRDYEELRPALYRLLAKVKRENVTQMNEEKLDELIIDALKEFRKIAWIKLEQDFFDVLPAFHRLNKIYADYINNIDNWIKKHAEK